MTKTIKSLDDVTPDPHNANRGTERGAIQVENSLANYGAGRSILVDKNGVAIAGNKTLEQAAAKGFEVAVVQTTGDKLVVVQRTDLDLMEDEQARLLAYADNRTSEVGFDADIEQMQRDLDSGLDLSDMYRDDELEALLAGVEGDGDPDGDAAPEDIPETWDILITCSGETQQRELLERFAEEGIECHALTS